ncbi:MAG: MFS transporter [Propionibacteriaceae bacterium]|jgi:MFS family permease|nr:MFS transporter [Propionibacteriaceae bacterium]
MSVAAGLQEVWRQRRFRRLLSVKLLSQTGDGIVQVGVASFALFSPERQPDAWAIAGVLAIMMLPFSVLGPFVSVVIDRWDRRRTVMTADVIRMALSVALAAFVLASGRSALFLAPIMVTALVVLSLERFQVATLLSGLPHTIDKDEFLAANTALPLVGPLGVMIGAAVAAAIRLTVGAAWSPVVADACIFSLGAGCFLFSAAVMRGFAPRSLGPGRIEVHRLNETFRDLAAAARHLGQRKPALLGLLLVAAQRTVFGFISVAVILLFRNYFHARDDIPGAIGDLALWALATGAGFVLASAVNPVLARRFGLRVTVVAALALSALFQAAPGSFFIPPALVVASFLIGLWAQCVKMNCDTLIQAHVADEFKGRVLVLYDIAFNTPMVIAGVIAALLLPDDGRSRAAFLGCAVLYLALAAVFAGLSRRIGTARFSQGTESLTGKTGPTPVGAGGPLGREEGRQAGPPPVGEGAGPGSVGEGAVGNVALPDVAVGNAAVAEEAGEI